jgi:hypothetical protein
MGFWAVTPMFLLVLFVGMLLFLEIGRRVGMRRTTEGPGSAGLAAVEGALFAVLGLLIGFTFSGAATRFDARRQLVAEEANAIGTAYLRIELLPADKQPAMRDLFRQYLDTRLAAYQKIPDVASVKTELARAEALQKEIWTNAVAASRESNTTAAPMLLLPALNQMIDITTTRNMATLIHPPTIIFAMLGILALACSLLAGYGMAGGKTRSWIHILSFAAILTFAVYVILDLEYPRLGFIRVSAVDQVLVDLRHSMD